MTTHYELYLSTIPRELVKFDPQQALRIAQASPYRRMDVKGKAKVVMDSSGDEMELTETEIDKHLAANYSDDDEEEVGDVIYASDMEEEDGEEETDEEVKDVLKLFVQFKESAKLSFDELQRDAQVLWDHLTKGKPGAEDVHLKWVKRYRSQGCEAVRDILSWFQDNFYQLKFKMDLPNQGQHKLPEGVVGQFTEQPVGDRYHSVHFFGHHNLQENGRFLSNGQAQRKRIYLNHPTTPDPENLNGDDLACIIWLIHSFYHSLEYIRLQKQKPRDALRWYINNLMVMQALLE